MRPARGRRPYVFYDVAVAVCSTCLRRAEAKIIFQEGKVLLDKWCAEHGRERVLLADDIPYWRRARERLLQHAEMPLHPQTPLQYGCPYDCGLCPDHQQHSCLTVVDITDRCNLSCPICYASSGPHRRTSQPLAQVLKMLDAVVTSEGEPDVVQISGGEPTLHPQLFEILDACKARPIRHLMLNTNGLRIAQEEGFAERLASYLPGFEVYLQFDSLHDEVHTELRGAKLAAVRQRALERLEAAQLSTTLVVTVRKGLNDHQLGEIIEHALQWRCVRGVTFQPIQEVGRLEGYDPAVHRLTLTEVRRRILEQSPVFTERDLIPVPCHPDALAMAYALKTPQGVTPLTRYVDPESLAEGADSTILFEQVPAVRQAVHDLYSAGIGPESQATKLADLMCCLPRVEVGALSYEHIFRVMIVRFMDARDLEVRGVKRSCIHFARPDGHLIPFDTYNLLYRDERAARLQELRRARQARGRHESL